MITPEESRAWNPALPGWSDDILQFYSCVADELPHGAVCVELGVNCGRSLCFLDERLRGLDKAYHLVGVDKWEGDEGKAQLRTMFDGYARASSLELLSWDTAEAAKGFSDRSLDFIFIDADHSFEGVLRDLRAWQPKLKRGGILAGHDYSQADWPGVVKAVDGWFGITGVLRPVGSIWRAIL